MQYQDGKHQRYRVHALQLLGVHGLGAEEHGGEVFFHRIVA